MSIMQQVMNLDKNQMEWLCNHLGHKENVHKTHYRQMSGLIERVHLTKLMMIQDGNMQQRYAGQNLMNVDITGETYNDATFVYRHIVIYMYW